MVALVHVPDVDEIPISALCHFFPRRKRSGVLLRGPACCYPRVLLRAESCVRGSGGSLRCMWSTAAWRKGCADVSQPWSCLRNQPKPTAEIHAALSRVRQKRVGNYTHIS